MASKIIVWTFVFSSVFFLSGCGTKTVSTDTPVNVNEVDNIDISLPLGSPFALIDFGASETSETVPDDDNKLWNNYNYYRVSGQSQALQNVRGDSTGIRLKTQQKFTGTSSPLFNKNLATSARFPLVSVAQDYFWLNASSEGVLVFSNLPPERNFIFVLYGSSVNDGSSHTARYTLTGATVSSDEIQLVGNLNGVVILSAQADANGEVALSVAAAASSTFARLNAIEIILAKSHYSDADSDGIPDDWEAANGLNSSDANDAIEDFDVDTANNLIEFRNGTDPNRSDSDGDGMVDGWEIVNHLNPTNEIDAFADPDNDGYSNFDEHLYGFDPFQFTHTQFPGTEPTLLSVTSQTDSIISLAWIDNSVGEDGFKLERRVNGGDWLTYESLAADTSSYSDAFVTVGETYNYRVAAYNTAGLSVYTNIVTVMIDPVELSRVEPIPRLDHLDGEYGIVRYGRPTELDYIVPSGHSRIVLFAVSYEQDTDGVLAKDNDPDEGQVPTDKTISDVSYGGVPLKRAAYVKTIKHEDGHQNHVEIWYLLEADLAKTTDSTWQIDWFEFIDDNDNLRGLVATYANVNQAVTFADIQEVSTNTMDELISLNIATATQGYLVVQAVVGNAGSADNWSSGFVELQDLSFSGVVSSTAVMATDGSTVSANVVLNSNSLRRALLALSLRASARDTDQDAMPDYWEDLYGLDSVLSTDAAGDLDGDGFTNLEEYLAGTDPG